MANKAARDVELQMCPETGFVTEVPIAAAAPAAPAGSLDQVREILFGPMTQSFEQRLTDVEQRLAQAFTDLSASSQERIDQLERYIKEELTGLLEKLGKQRDERAAQFQELKTEVASCISTTERASSELSEKLLELRTETTAELARQVNLLMEELEQRSAATAEDLARETESLRGDLVDRAGLASVLEEMSRRVATPGVTAFDPAQ